MDIILMKKYFNEKLAEAYDDENFKPEEDAEKLRYAMKGSILLSVLGVYLGLLNYNLNLITRFHNDKSKGNN